MWERNLYSKENTKINLDFNYYLSDYYLINEDYENEDYENIMLIGSDKEIIDFFKNFYEKEKLKNKNLNELNKKNEIKILELNLKIFNLNSDFQLKEKNINFEKNKLQRENEDLKEKNIALKNAFKLQKENKDLEKKELQKENEDLKEKNTNLKNLLFNFDNDKNKEGEYDIVLCVDSIKNLTSDGWKIKYNKTKGKEEYEELKKKDTIVVGVVGNGNKGKSFLLKKLSNYEVPMGFNVKTEGLSIIYGKTEKQCLAILDSAGQETPLLIQNKNNNINNKNNDNDKKINKDELEFEEYSRDKLVTEFYIQQFILWKSNIIILLVGSITLSEQKLYTRVKNEILTIQENQKQPKKLFIVHNLQNFYHKDDVKDYIENTLKKLYNIELKENSMYDPNCEIIGFDKYYLEKDNNNIIHLLFINDYCDYSDYFNKNTIWFLTQAISQEACRRTLKS